MVLKTKQKKYRTIGENVLIFVTARWIFFISTFDKYDKEKF